MIKLRSGARDRRAFAVVAFAASSLGVAYAGCGNDGGDTGTGGSGVETTQSVSSSSGGVLPVVGSTSASSSSSSTASSSSASSTSTGGSGGGGGDLGGSGGGGNTATGGAGQGGEGGAGGSFGFPFDCTTQPANVPTTQITQIWSMYGQQATPTPVWVPSAYVTAISGTACQAGVACQIFLQQDETYASLAAGKQHGIKLFVSARTAQYFTSVKVNDKVQVYGQAWRYDVDGQNELLIQVSLRDPGCIETIGQGNPTPILAQHLSELSISGYEDDIGPLLLQITDEKVTGQVHGRVKGPAQTFVIFDDSEPSDAGPDSLVALSPTFLAGATFTGLPASGTTVDFPTGVVGVFGLFIPPMQTPPVTKFMEIYPRTAADYPHP